MRLLCVIIAILWAAPTFSEDSVLNSSPQSDDLLESSNAAQVQEVFVDNSTSIPVVQDDIGKKENKETNSGANEQKAMPSQAKAKRESVKNKSSSNNEYEQTYLDLFGDRAKELLMQIAAGIGEWEDGANLILSFPLVPMQGLN
eukprot:scaffold882_cov67-Cyclotella_meneghiniana.AAC.4